MRRMPDGSKVAPCRSLLLAALLPLALAAGESHAQATFGGTLKKIKETGSITLGHREASAPFSYVDERQQAIGYSMDICAAIVEEVKVELQLPALSVKYVLVTPQTRIPLTVNGTIDLECGSTSNTLSRQKLVAFSPVTFITGTKLLVRRSSRIKGYKDLRNKTVVVTQGTTNERLMKALSDKENLNIKFLNAKDHNEAFLTVESGRAAAFSMDDILLYGQLAKAKNPKDYEIVGNFLSYEPYGIMFRANDDSLGVVVRRAVARFFGEAGACNGPIKAVYKKWFLDKAPSGEIMGVPMSPLLEAACRVNALPE
ncbi:MAG: amino acid ABC transporter substrate-binding protein [Usitatibacter sp.]